MTIKNTVVTGNHATGRGGGMATKYALTLSNSTISANRADMGAGGLYDEGGPQHGGAVMVENSTITGNTSGGKGGGVYTTDDDPTEFRSSTIAGNQATGTGGGIYAEFSGAVTLTNTIVADNAGTPAPDVANLAGSTTTATFSLIENTAGTILGTTTSSITGQDPKLGPLADNGGSSSTMSLLPGSPALDHGLAAGLDQRGLARPFDLAGVPSAPGGNAADIGAYERVLCGKVAVNQVGTEGKDTLVGTSGADGILGLGGKDKIKGLAGKDGLCGGPGKDTLIGGGGNDVLLGQGGPDILRGGKGKDKLKGGPGQDAQTQ
jgi:predicted outer membrane repeat protein